MGAAGRHPAAVTAAGLAGLVFILFHPALLGRGVFFQRDIAAYWYPYIEAAVRLVAEGGWPTWNPWVSFGRPLLADPAMQLVYPLTWLNLILPPAAYYAVFVVAHCWATGFGACLWARHASLSPAAAALAGALWCTSGPLLSAVNLFHHFAGAAWIPWVLLALARALDKPGAASALLLGAAAGGQALAGSADMCLMTALAATVQAAAFVWARRGSRRRAILSVAGVAAASAVYAVLLAAVQWLPALAQFRGGSRNAQDLATTSFWSVHPASLADLFVPRLLADLTASPEIRAQLFEGRAPFLLCLYLGAASLPLVVVALAGRRHPPLTATWAFSFALFVLLALGRHAPLHPLLAAVPPFAWLRYPVKFMLPAALFWAMLAGLGLDRVRQPWADRDRRTSRAALLVALAAAPLAVWLAAAQVPPSLIAASAGKLAAAAALMIATAALIGWRAGRERAPSWLAAALLVVALADVARVGRHVNALAPPALLRYRPPLADALAAAGPDARLYVRQESNDELNRLLVRGPGGWDSEAGWALGAQQMLMPPIGARWGVSSSYDGDFTGMAPQALSTLSALVPTVESSPLSLKLLRMAAVTHVASLRERPFDGLEEAGAWESVFAAPVRLFRVPEPLPRIYVVHAARSMSETAALAALADPSFDPAREVLLLPAAGTNASGSTTNAEAPAVSPGSVRIVLRRPDALAVEVALAAPGWLVAVEGYDPAWTARVDGMAAPVLRANLLFRAVPVPSGPHRVELRYRPPLLALSGALSAAALAGGLAVAATRRGDKN
jgi:hypothetical protein